LIKGTPINDHYSIHFHGYVYEYVCGECGKKFRSTSPEANEPVLCDHCFHGGQPPLLRHHLKNNPRKVKPETNED
jgi:NAD-dependent SIR2 family protein deacetylase